jgi:acyl carrier protein
LWGLAGPVGPAAGLGIGGDPAGQLAAMSAVQRGRHLAGLVQAHAAAVLGYRSPAAVDPGSEFRNLGFDSLSAVEFRNQLAAATGLRLSATLVYDYPTPAALAAHLARELDPGAADGPPVDGDAADSEIRSLLASVPIARLRETGMLEQLLRLTAAASTATLAKPGKSIDEMGVDELVRAAMNGASHPSHDNGANQ